jgi:hypothetical protein
MRLRFISDGGEIELPGLRRTDDSAYRPCPM